MDDGTLLAAIVALFISGGALGAWIYFISSIGITFYHYPLFYLNDKLQTKNRWIFVTSAVVALTAITWIWVTKFHWVTVVAFFWPYAMGYLWCRFVLKVAIKVWQLKSIFTIFTFVFTILGFSATVLAIIAPGWLLTTFNSSIVTFLVTFLGIGGLVSAVVLFVTLIIGTESDINYKNREAQEAEEERKRKNRADLSDEAIRYEMLQRINEGKEVSQDEYPDIEIQRIQHIMAALESELASAALVYDAIETTLAYRNARGVRRIHEACARIALQYGRDSASALVLVRAFINELGLPDVDLGIRQQASYFLGVEVQAGSLSSVLPPTFPVFVPSFGKYEVDQSAKSIQKEFNEKNSANRFAIVLSPIGDPLLRELLTQPDKGGIQENIVYFNEEDMRAIITSKSSDIRAVFMHFVQKSVRLTESSEAADKALHDEILQQITEGKEVSRDDYSYIEIQRIQHIMAALEGELASVALVYDAIETTLAYRNARGVRRIHEACARVRDSTSAFAEVSACVLTLVRVFINELGLPDVALGIKVRPLYALEQPSPSMLQLPSRSRSVRPQLSPDPQAHSLPAQQQKPRPSQPLLPEQQRISSPVSQRGKACFLVVEVLSGSLSSVLPSTFPVFVSLLSEEEIRGINIVEIFQKGFNEENPANRFAIVLSPFGESILRDLLAQPDEGGHRENIVYFNEKDMRTIITSKALDSKAAFMHFVRKNVRLTTVAPFITKGPTSGEMFFGREREISTILENVASHSYAILGGRRIGKTSMLHKIKSLLQKRGYRVLDLDCSAVGSYQEFYRTIRTDWALELGTFTLIDDLPVTFREIVTAFNTHASYLSKTPSPLIFVLDEIDRLLDFDIRQENAEQLFRTFRSLSQGGRCQFIFSGERRIYQQLSDNRSPLYNFFTPIKLGLLELNDARRLIEVPIETNLGIPLEEGRVLTDIIVDACSCHPNLIQRACKEILDRLDQDKSTLAPRVTREIVMDVINQYEFRREYLDVFWGQSTPLEKVITLLIATEESVTTTRIAYLLQQNEFQVSQEELDIALGYLTLYCVFQYFGDKGVTWTATHFIEIPEEEIQQYIVSFRKQFLKERNLEK